MIQQTHISLLLASTLALAGCGERIASAGAHSASDPPNAERVARPALPALVVIGVDRTETFERMTRTALGLAERTLRAARPQDELVFRWISDRSYRSDETFVHVKLPAIPASTGNPFDEREKRALAAAKQRFAAEARKGIEAIRAQHPEGPTASTDIPGFLMAASEQFAVAPAGYRKVLVIASDMEDNRKYKVRPDLSGVDVQIYLLVIKAQPDPAEGTRLKQQWSNFLTKTCKAASVSFMPVNS